MAGSMQRLPLMGRPTSVRKEGNFSLWGLTDFWKLFCRYGCNDILLWREKWWCRVSNIGVVRETSVRIACTNCQAETGRVRFCVH